MQGQLADEAAQNRLLAAARARQVLQLERKVSALTERLGLAERATTEVASRGAAEVYALKDRLQAAEEAAVTAEQRCQEASKEKDELRKVWSSNFTSSSSCALLSRSLRLPVVKGVTW